MVKPNGDWPTPPPLPPRPKLTLAVLHHAHTAARDAAERMKQRSETLSAAIMIFDGIEIAGLQGNTAAERAENFLKMRGCWPL